MRAQRLELVGRGDPRHAAGHLGQCGDKGFREPGGCVEAGAHRSAALREAAEARPQADDAGCAVFAGLRVGAHFLAKRDGGGVLQVGAADLDDVGPGGLLGAERGGQRAQRGEQTIAGFERDRDVHRSWEGVVRGLAAVDVIVWVDGRFAAANPGQQFVGAARDHLVRVHIGLRAAAGLPDHQRELIVVQAVGDFGGGFLDRVGERGVEAVLAVDLCGGLFDAAERADQRDGHSLAADGEIGDRALRLRAPIGLGGHLDRAETVGFGAGLDHGHHFLRKRSSVTTLPVCVSGGRSSTTGSGGGAGGEAPSFATN